MSLTTRPTTTAFERTHDWFRPSLPDEFYNDETGRGFFRIRLLLVVQ